MPFTTIPEFAVLLMDQLDQPTVSEQSGQRYLHFDSPWIQGAMSLKRPDKLVLSYTEQMMAWLLFLTPDPDRVIGQLGLGAGSLTRFCFKHLKNPLAVIERNPAVTRVCEQFFRLPVHERLVVVHEDAQRWVLDPVNVNSLAVLMVDLYDAEAAGPVCDSLAFYRGCARVLEAPGVLSVNLFGHHDSYQRNIDRLAQAFGGRLLLLPPVEEGNQIVLAFKGPEISASFEQLQARADWLTQQMRLPAKRWVKSIGPLTRL